MQSSCYSSYLYISAISWLLFSSFVSIDNQIIPQTTVLPLSYVEFGNDSLKVEPNNATWWEAKRRCEADGAQLASIRDGITQAYIELQINKLKQPVWIGLNKNEVIFHFCDNLCLVVLIIC